MPHVASEPKISAPHSYRPRQTPRAEQAASPFDSMLDDAARAPAPDKRDDQTPKPDKVAAQSEPAAGQPRTSEKASASESPNDAQAKDAEDAKGAVDGPDAQPEAASAPLAKSALAAKTAAELLAGSEPAETDVAAETAPDQEPSSAPIIAVAAMAVPAVVVAAKTATSLDRSAGDVEADSVGTTLPLGAGASTALLSGTPQAGGKPQTEFTEAAAPTLHHAAKAEHASGEAVTPAQAEKAFAAQLAAIDSSGGIQPPAQAHLAHQTHTAQNVTAAAPQHSGDQTTPPVPVDGIAIEIANRAIAGKNRFEIRLDPPELGRIDVRLDVDRHGNVSSRLVVERADTLHLLRQDAPALERALQNAGLKMTGDSLQFSLRDQTQQQQQHTVFETTGSVADDIPSEIAPRAYTRIFSRGGVDIQV